MLFLAEANLIQLTVIQKLFFTQKNYRTPFTVAFR